MAPHPLIKIGLLAALLVHAQIVKCIDAKGRVECA